MALGKIEIPNVRGMLKGETKVNEPKKEPDKFETKCICDWSEKDKYGFIPNTECPVHGEDAKRILKKTISYDKEGKSGKFEKLKKDAKFWIVAFVIAVFGGLVVWRLIGKF